MGRITIRRVAFFAWAFVLLGGRVAEGSETLSAAVLPYLTVGVSDSDAAAISEVLARELAARTGAKVKAGAQLKEKLPPLPDGCPREKACVEEVAATLEVDHLLFAIYLDEGVSIEVTLIYLGDGEERQTKFALEPDPTSWNDSIRKGLAPVLPAPSPRVEGNKKPLYARWWFWGGVGGVTAAVAGFFLLQPSLGFAD